MPLNGGKVVLLLSDQRGLLQLTDDVDKINFITVEKMKQKKLIKVAFLLSFYACDWEDQHGQQYLEYCSNDYILL